MLNGWSPMTSYAAEIGPVDLWIERPGFAGRLIQNCRYSKNYGWLDEIGRTVPQSEIRAWREPMKGPFDGDQE